MFAKRDNKVYQVDNVTMKEYLAKGYDICDDKGNVIKHSPKASVPYAEYEKVVNELESLKKAKAGKGKSKVSENSTDSEE